MSADAMFHEVPVGGLFRWRGKNWLKSDQTHGVQENAPGTGPEHIPSHDAVEIVQQQPSKTKATRN